MVILGLTGSIGMGKTVAAGMFSSLGVPVHDADAAVHRILAENHDVIGQIKNRFPGIAETGPINREVLGARVFGDEKALTDLEAILHPAVRWDQFTFLARAARQRVPLAVLDIPLLFETCADLACDFVAVVTAPSCVQKHRVLRRPGMTRDKLKAILSRQMPDTEKTRRADFLIHSGLGRHAALREVRRIVTLARRGPGRKWPWRQSDWDG